MSALKPARDNETVWHTTVFCTESEDGETPYMKISFPKGFETLDKVNALVDVIKIIVQDDPAFKRGEA